MDDGPFFTLSGNWKVAEEAYDQLAKLHGYKFSGKIDLALADYDEPDQEKNDELEETDAGHTGKPDQASLRGSSTGVLAKSASSFDSSPNLSLVSSASFIAPPS